ncbi:hypothetical protein LEMLEM_LOCUS24504 [Lemmus lemmus]
MKERLFYHGTYQIVVEFKIQGHPQQNYIVFLLAFIA